VATVIPATTKAAVYEGNGTVVVREMPLPKLAKGELLVRIRACGLCASEILRWYADAKAPFGLGHEPVGEIAACGDGAAPAGAGPPFREGERVFIHHHAPCMTCRRCLRGDYVQCETWRATRISPGAMAQWAVVGEPSVRHDVLRVPAALSDERATFVEPLATVLKSVRRAQLKPGDRVLVIGLGAMGMLHALVARSRGAQLVLGADRVASRLAHAAGFGVDAALDIEAAPLRDQVMAQTGGDGAEIVFVTPGSRAALDAAAACVARGGTIVAFTPLPPNEMWSIGVNDLFFRDVAVMTSYSAGPGDTREALDMLGAGLGVDALVTHRFPLGEAAQAYATLKQAGEALKVIVYPA
jgi:L-iditol 2-dehydrogenase